MLTLRRFGILSVTGLLTTAAFAQQHEHDHHHDEEHEQHAAHVHGHAKLLVAVEGKTLELIFETPAMNLLGFEHKPQSKEQKQKTEEVLSALNTPEKLFSMPQESACSLAEKQIDAPFNGHAGNSDHDNDHGHDHKHDHKHDHEKQAGAEAEHSDYSARYRFNCENAEQIGQISVQLFKLFPLTESIDVQSISPLGQKAYELTSVQNKIPL